ncbi:MAG TPA: ATP-binding protein [Candidatus Tectomicrobia bacterium]|nr:ATP-binding protein [Candidatus Tectomicrobia bacterium]
MEDAPRILVVDDEPGPRAALLEILHPKYRVMMAENGPDALQLLNTSPADLVMLDLKMPGMSGIDVLKAIKEADANIEAIMMTAYASLETIRGAMAYGASAYLIKPFGEDEVEEAVTKALARRAGRTGGQQEVRALLAQLLTLTQPAADVMAVEPIGIVLSQVQRLLGATTVLLYLRDAAEAPFRERIALDSPPALREVLDSPAWVGLLEESVAAGQVLILHAGPSRERTMLPPTLVAQGYTGALFCPLRLAPEGEGVLACLASTARPWHDDSVALVRTVVELLALALHTQQRYQASQQTAAQHAQRATQLGIQRAISQVILSQLELPAILEALSDQLQAGLGYAGFYVWLTTSAGSHLQQVYGSGPNFGWQPADSTPIPAALEVAHLPNAQVVLAPIVLQGQAVGVLKLVRDAPQDALTPVELDLLRLLLDSIALAVHNSRLYGEVASTKSFLENLVQGAGDAIFTVDTADRITSWNTSAEQIFQASAAAMLHQPVWTLLPREAYGQWRAEVEAHGQSLQVYTRLTPSGGTPRDVLLTLSPLRGPRDTLAGLSAICKDVTEARQLREQVLQAEKLRVVGEMAAGIAHNFNNVLTTILTRAQMLAQQVTDATALQRGLNLIAQAASDGATIVRRLQQLARGPGASEVEVLDLNAVVRGVVETTQPVWHDHAAQAGRPVEVRLELSTLPQIAGRAAELREVLTNLLLNAVEAMPQGGQLVLRSWAEGGEVCVAVSDTGVGMTPEVQRRLFDPFFTTKGARGTGLGLSVSQALIKGHHGTLTVQSAPGRGTTFVLRLPVSAASA